MSNRLQSYWMRNGKRCSRRQSWLAFHHRKAVRTTLRGCQRRTVKVLWNAHVRRVARLEGVNLTHNLFIQTGMLDHTVKERGSDSIPAVDANFSAHHWKPFGCSSDRQTINDLCKPNQKHEAIEDRLFELHRRLGHENSCVPMCVFLQQSELT